LRFFFFFFSLVHPALPPKALPAVLVLGSSSSEPLESSCLFLRAAILRFLAFKAVKIEPTVNRLPRDLVSHRQGDFDHVMQGMNDERWEDNKADQIAPSAARHGF
jgi:hypothetical protein